MTVERRVPPPHPSRRPRPSRRPERASLTRESIIAHAIQVGNHEGLAVVSFRRLSSDLGVTPMALYRHVRDKDDLLDGILDTIVGQVDLAAIVQAQGGWEGKLRLLLDAYRHLLQANPVAVALLSGRRAVTPNWLRTIEAGLGILREAGFPVRESVTLLRQITNRLVGLVSLETATAPAPSDDLDALLRQGRAILQARPLAEFPNVIEAAPYLARCDDPERYYQFGLELLIDGVKAQLVKFR